MVSGNSAMTQSNSFKKNNIFEYVICDTNLCMALISLLYHTMVQHGLDNINNNKQSSKQRETNVYFNF